MMLPTHWLLENWAFPQNQTADYLMIQEWLQLMGLPHKPADVKEMFDRLEAPFLRFQAEYDDKLAQMNLSHAERQRVMNRLLFQFKQHQIATALIVPALDKNNHAWGALWKMETHHLPQPKVLVLGNRVTQDAILRGTVEAGRKELRLSTSEDEVNEMWVTLSSRAQMMAFQTRIARMVEWSKTRKWPESEEQMDKIFETDLLNAANQIIHDYLTEPIAARQEEIERERERLEALL